MVPAAACTLAATTKVGVETAWKRLGSSPPNSFSNSCRFFCKGGGASHVVHGGRAGVVASFAPWLPRPPPPRPANLQLEDQIED